MGLLQDIQKRIRTKEAEIVDISAEIRELEKRLEGARQYILGLQEILPKIQKDENGISSDMADGKTECFRTGSAPELVQQLLKRTGKPLYINDILSGLGRSPDKKARLSLVGTLGRLSRQGIVFKKTAPNTFGLIDLVVIDNDKSQQELPAEFGK